MGLIYRPLAGCNQYFRVNKKISRRSGFLRPLTGCDVFCWVKAMNLIRVTYVPLRGVMAKMNKSDRPETGRMYLFHNAGIIITHSAQKEKRNGEKNAAFSGANRAGGARKKHEF